LSRPPVEQGIHPAGSGAPAATGGPRRFGLTVGGIFLLLAAISLWRGHEIPPRVLGTLGVLLVVPGLLFPRVLGPVERVWMRFAEVLAFVNTRLILGLVFYVVLTPIGAVMRLFRDPLDRRLDDGTASNWAQRPIEPVDPARYRHQF
jgi:multisubunit Na+/H+ antiporter MnhG subunit